MFKFKIIFPLEKQEDTHMHLRRLGLNYAT